MANYDINYNKLIYWLNHPILNRSDLYNLLRCLIAPVSYLKGAFDTYKKEVAYKIKITSQVVYLERALNDSFDYTERRISIGNIQKKEATFLYDRSVQDQLNEDEKTYLYDRADDNPHYLYDRKSFGLGGFIVVVPFQLTNQQLIKMKSKLDYYKLPGKEYIIVQDA